jgi:hypothetical protein
MSQQQLDELGGASGPHGRVHRRTRGVLDVPAGVGAGLEEQPAPLGVADADWSGERYLNGVSDVRQVIEQQPQAPVSVTGESDHVEVVVFGNRTALQQQPDDRLIANTGAGSRGRAAQRRSATALAPPSPGSGFEVSAGVQQQSGHGQQPG